MLESANQKQAGIGEQICDFLVTLAMDRRRILAKVLKHR